MDSRLSSSTFVARFTKRLPGGQNHIVVGVDTTIGFNRFEFGRSLFHKAAQKLIFGGIQCIFKDTRYELLGVTHEEL